MSGTASPGAGSRWSSVATCAFGGLVGGLAGAVLVVGVTLAFKEAMDFVSSQATWFLIVVPLLGMALAVLVLQGVGQTLVPGATPPRVGRWALAWRAFPPRAVRADITGDVVDTAGEEEHFNWRVSAPGSMRSTSTSFFCDECPPIVCSATMMRQRGIGWPTCVSNADMNAR